MAYILPKVINNMGREHSRSSGYAIKRRRERRVDDLVEDEMLYD